LKDAWRSGVRLAALAWPVPQPPPAVTLEPERLNRLLADAGGQRR
jgi:hypothetical protein